MQGITTYYTVSEISHSTNIKPSTIYSLIRNGDLQCIMVGNKYLIDLDNFNQCLEKHKVK